MVGGPAGHHERGQHLSAVGGIKSQEHCTVFCSWWHRKPNYPYAFIQRSSVGLQDQNGPGSTSPLPTGVGHDWKTPDHFFIIMGDVVLCAGCIGGYVLYTYCPSHNSFLTPLGHEDTFKAGVLHRDISVGNILIINRQGILINWDLSKWLVREANSKNEVRQPTRTVRSRLFDDDVVSLTFT